MNTKSEYKLYFILFNSILNKTVILSLKKKKKLRNNKSIKTSENNDYDSTRAVIL